VNGVLPLTMPEPSPVPCASAEPGARVQSTVRVGRFLSRAEAEVARGFLASQGIEARVLGDDMAGVHPEASYGYGGVALAVHPDDEVEARELLASSDPPIDRSELRPRGWRPTLIVAVAALVLLLYALEIGQGTARILG
jgi:hypothetical protein